jgi:RimJ/RimL family protein N-acetyltransferase
MIHSAKRGVKKAVSLLLQDYRINYIYASPAEQAPVAGGIVELSAEQIAQLAASQTAKVRGSATFSKAGLKGYALVEAGKPVCVVHLAELSQYDRAATWPLRQGEAAIMDIATEDAARGRGLAVRLIEAVTARYLRQGRTRIIAFIWWSNTPSLRAFAKAGWRRIGFSVELQVASHWVALRLPLPRQP